MACARGFPDPVPPDRLILFRYANAEHGVEYIAVMRVLCGTLLADMSAPDVRERLLETGLDLPLETVEERCLQLVRWTNLMRSVHDPHVPTVADYRHAQKRFQVTPLGGRVHRMLDEVLHAVDGAREVARELLGSIVVLLDKIADKAGAGGGVDAEALAAHVTTVFNNQRLFTDSVRDFYAYLGSVLTRYDLVGEEYSTFKGLLLEYVDLIGADVARHAPGIVDRLTRLAPLLDTVVAVLGTLPTLVNADGSPIERLPGRQLGDWEELTAWYTGAGGPSGPAQLRAAAEAALGQLITNAKRMLASTGTGASRRADLLRLAGLLHRAREGDAQRGFAAAFGFYSARHLGLGPPEGELGPSAGVSWWDAPAVEVPVALRERGSRTSLGRNGKVPDPVLDRALLTAQAEQEDILRRAAAAELLAAGDLDGTELSAAAFWQVLLPLFTALLARHPEGETQSQFTDRDLGLVLSADLDAPRSTVVSWAGGSATFAHVVLVCRAAPAAGQAPAPPQEQLAGPDGDAGPGTDGGGESQEHGGAR